MRKAFSYQTAVCVCVWSGDDITALTSSSVLVSMNRVSFDDDEDEGEEHQYAVKT